MKSKTDKNLNSSQRGSLDKEAYVTPRVEFVEISVEESLMGICKTGGGAGPGPVVCDTCLSGGS